MLVDLRKRQNGLYRHSNHLTNNVTSSLTLHGCLQGIYGVNLCDDDASSEPSQSLDAAFAHVAVAGHHGHFTRDHHVRGSLDTVDQALPAAIKVVKLTLQHKDHTHVMARRPGERRAAALGT